MTENKKEVEIILTKTNTDIFGKIVKVPESQIISLGGRYYLIRDRVYYLCESGSGMSMFINGVRGFANRYYDLVSKSYAVSDNRKDLLPYINYNVSKVKVENL